MKNKYYTSRDPIKNYFPLPNEVFALGLSPGGFFTFLLPSSIPVPVLRPFVDAHGVGSALVCWLLLQRRGILPRRVSSLEMGVKFSRYRAAFR